MTAVFLPTEVLQHIYLHTSAIDFNHARYVNRSWFVSSLDRDLLVIMLKRLGFWRAAEAELMSSKSRRTYERNGTYKSEIRFLSIYLSRECSLLSPSPSFEELCSRKEYSLTSAKVISHVACFNMFNLTEQGSYSGNRPIKFKVSSCKRFVLTAQGNVIYVYKLDGTEIHAWTKVIYPRTVFAMCMDTSSESYILGAILSDGPAVICDLNPKLVSLKRTTFINRDPLYWQSMYGRHCTHDKHDAEDIGDICGKGWLGFNGIDLYTGSGENFNINNLDDERTYADNYINQTWNVHSLTAPDISTTLGPTGANLLWEGPHTIIPNDGSSLTVPNSIAVCAKRRCVALGVYNGVELHWTDQITGEDMTHLFATKGVHDIINFVPVNFGSRLSERVQILASMSCPMAGFRGSDRSYFGENFASEFLLSSHFAKKTDEASNYHGILPLDDGYHVIYLDPKSKSLCLGCHFSPQRQTAIKPKLIFSGPPHDARVQSYKFLTRKRGGIILIAGFRFTSRNLFYMYSVPPELLAAPIDLPCTTSITNAKDGVKVASNLTTNMVWAEWWPFRDSCHKRDHIENSTFWPIAMRGIYFAENADVADIAIQFDRQLIVWIFKQNGEAAVYSTDDIYDIHRHLTKHQHSNGNKLPLGSLRFQLDTDAYRTYDYKMDDCSINSLNMESNSSDSGYDSVKAGSPV